MCVSPELRHQATEACSAPCGAFRRSWKQQHRRWNSAEDILTSKRNSTESNAPLHMFSILVVLLIPYVQAWGCKDNPNVEGFPWSACLKVTPDGEQADLIDAPWRGPPGYDCSMDAEGGHDIPTCCSKHEEDMPKILSQETLKKDCKHLDGRPFEWPPRKITGRNWR
ncbi:hypothetical protein KEM48_014580 [Puccinia striiformis f. sp. tritici PST-130]|nr:hypothetical protein KEM48_014580 [Puccinia striiformis f. sp. tritici PST-130]